MPRPETPFETVRFGAFEANLRARELRKHGVLVKLSGQPFEILALLLERPGDVVTRQELQERLWPADTFVDFEHGMNNAIKKLRTSLGDAADRPLYVETLARVGYRFIAPTERLTVGEYHSGGEGTGRPDLTSAAEPADGLSAEHAAKTVPPTERTATGPRPPASMAMQDGESSVNERHSPSHAVIEQTDSAPGETSNTLRARLHHKVGWKYRLPTGLMIALLVLATAFFLPRRQPIALGEKDSALVADFTNTTGDPVFDGTLRQGLAVQLEQSPFLSLVSEERIQRALLLMGQPADARLTPELAREICARTASAAVLEGSITSLGSQYVLGLRAKNCRTGDVLDEEQAQAARKEDVLDALSQIASRFRTRVGESLSMVEKHDTSLAEATTPSLEALKAYSAGWKVSFSSGSAAAIPFFKRAVEIDPNFASAYALLGRLYGDIGEAVLSAKNTGKAYRLRNHASDQEKFFISVSYDFQVTGNLEKAQQTCDLWIQTYPRAWLPHGLLSGGVYPPLGKYEKATEEAQTAIRIDPDFSIGYANLAASYVSRGRTADAENTLQRAFERKLEIPDFFVLRYAIAFLNDNKTEMEREAALAREKPGAEDWIANSEGLVLAYSGRLEAARNMSRLAADLARKTERRDTEALYATDAAVREALFGNVSSAKQGSARALGLSKSRDVGYGAGLALALSGDSPRSHALSDDLAKRFPEDTRVQFIYLPTLRALLALNNSEPSKAIESLQTAIPYELGTPTQGGSEFLLGAGNLYPAYVRGLAYLAAHQGREAAREFQKILNHRGIVVCDPIRALAHLQLGRAYAAAGDKTEARSAYHDFLTLWKDADPNIPILRQAKAEYARLQ